MLSKRCCCSTLRTGSLILAVITSFLGDFIGMMLAILFAFGEQGMPDLVNNAFTIQGFFYFIAYGFLLFGIRKLNEEELLVCLIMTIVSIFMEMIFCVNAIAIIINIAPHLDHNEEMKSATIGKTAQVFIVGSLIRAYICFVVHSLYKAKRDAKQEREGKEDFA